ncbi:MAG TPA: hypothetical protein GXZ37_05480 [Clostridiales bacterium]|jgi:hypothetical protein|nr:hypothetical protein [Clostridiales bacterium]
MSDFLKPENALCDFVTEIQFQMRIIREKGMKNAAKASFSKEADNLLHFAGNRLKLKETMIINKIRKAKNNTKHEME